MKFMHYLLAAVVLAFVAPVLAQPGTDPVAPVVAPVLTAPATTDGAVAPAAAPTLGDAKDVAVEAGQELVDQRQAIIEAWKTRGLWGAIGAAVAIVLAVILKKLGKKPVPPSGDLTPKPDANLK